MSARLRVDLSGFDKLKASTPKAGVRALNRGLTAARTLLVRDTSQDLGLPQRVVKARVNEHKASASNLVAGITASGKRIPLIDFGASGPEPSRGRGRGVTVKAGKGRKRFEHAFIARARGRRAVFERTSKSQLPVVELTGPSVRHVAEKHADDAAARGIQVATSRLQHEMAFALREAEVKGR